MFTETEVIHMAVRTRTKTGSTRKKVTRARTTSTRKKAAGTRRARTATTSRRAGAAVSARASAKRRGAGGLDQKVRPDPVLAAVVGAAPMARTQVVKKFWAYVKARDLQAKNDRRKINSDDKLRPLFGGKKQVTMFEVTGLLARHAR
jgi:chromatin remodeling complex protein RSC6